MPLTNITKFGTLVPKTKLRFLKEFWNTVLSNQECFLETKNLKQFILTMVKENYGNLIFRADDESKTKGMVTNLYYLDSIPVPMSTENFIPKTQQQMKTNIDNYDRTLKAAHVKTCNRKSNSLMSNGNGENDVYLNETGSEWNHLFISDMNDFQSTTVQYSPTNQNISGQRKGDICFKLQITFNNESYLLVIDSKYQANWYKVFPKGELENNQKTMVLQECCQIKGSGDIELVEHSKNDRCPLSENSTVESSQDKERKALNQIAKQILEVENADIPVFTSNSYSHVKTISKNLQFDKGLYSNSNSSSILIGGSHNSLMNYIPQRLLCSYTKSDESKKINIGDLMPMPTKVPPEVQAQCELTLKIKDLMNNTKKEKNDNEKGADEPKKTMKQCPIYENKLKERVAKRLKNTSSKLKDSSESGNVSSIPDVLSLKRESDLNSKSLSAEDELRSTETNASSRVKFNRALQKYVFNEPQITSGDLSFNFNPKNNERVSVVSGNHSRVKNQIRNLSEAAKKLLNYEPKQFVDDASSEPVLSKQNERAISNSTERLYKIMNLGNEQSSEGNVLNEAKPNAKNERNSETNSKGATKSVLKVKPHNLNDKPNTLKLKHSKLKTHSVSNGVIELKERTAENNSNKLAKVVTGTVQTDPSKERTDEEKYNSRVRQQVRQVLNITRKTYRPLSNRRKALVKAAGSEPQENEEQSSKTSDKKDVKSQQNPEDGLKTVCVTNKLCDLLGLPKKAEISELEEGAKKQNETTNRLKLLFEMQKEIEESAGTEIEDTKVEDEEPLDDIQTVPNVSGNGLSAKTQATTPKKDFDNQQTRLEKPKLQHQQNWTASSSSNSKTDSTRKNDEFKEKSFRPKELSISEVKHEDNEPEPNKVSRSYTVDIDGTCRTWRTDQNSEPEMPTISKDYSKGHILTNFDETKFQKPKEVYSNRNMIHLQQGRLFHKDSKFLLRELTQQLQSNSREKQFKRNIHALLRDPTATEAFILKKSDKSGSQDDNDTISDDSKSSVIDKDSGENVGIPNAIPESQYDLDNSKLDKYGRNIFTMATSSNERGKFSIVNPMLMLKKLMAKGSGEEFDVAFERLKKQFYTFADKSILAIFLARGADCCDDFNATQDSCNQPFSIPRALQNDELNTAREPTTGKQIPKGIYRRSDFKFYPSNSFNETYRNSNNEQNDFSPK